MADNQKNRSEPTNHVNFAEYMAANLLVWVFLVLMAVAGFFTCGAVWDDVTRGVFEFLFLVVGGGVALVSVLDYFEDRYSADPVREGNK